MASMLSRRVATTTTITTGELVSRSEQARSWCCGSGNISQLAWRNKVDIRLCRVSSRGVVVVARQGEARSTNGAAISSAVQERVGSSGNGAFQCWTEVLDDEVIDSPSTHNCGNSVDDDEEEDIMSVCDEQLVKKGKLIDQLLYREKFIIRCYEVGTNRTASMETMANLLQEVACNHAQSVGFSTDGFATTPLMRKLHLIWVTTRMHIQIEKYPVWGDTVEIDTWYQGEGRIETRRDWIIRDDKTGDTIGRATSTWVMMNMDTRRLARIPDAVREEYMPFVPQPARWAFDHSQKNSSLTKITKPDSADFVRPNLFPRRNDLDMNQHVNNVTYIGWMLEGIPLEVSSTHELTQITLDYKRECQADDVVESLVSPENSETADVVRSLLNLKNKDANTNGKVNGPPAPCSNSSNCGHPPLLFLHVLRLAESGKDINLGRTEWRRKPTLQTHF